MIRNQFKFCSYPNANFTLSASEQKMFENEHTPTQITDKTLILKQIDH